VLDPACGSGNFLFVAYRSLRELEQRLLLRLYAQDKRQFAKVGLASGISPKSFFGIDVNENAVETAKVTLMLARRLAHRDAEKFWADHADELPGQDTHSLEFERDLPLDNLDANILCADALFTPWPEVEAIIGNPPFLGSRYLNRLDGNEVDEVVASFAAHRVAKSDQPTWLPVSKAGGRHGPKEPATGAPDRLICVQPRADPIGADSKRSCREKDRNLNRRQRSEQRADRSSLLAAAGTPADVCILHSALSPRHLLVFRPLSVWGHLH